MRFSIGLPCMNDLLLTRYGVCTFASTREDGTVDLKMGYSRVFTVPGNTTYHTVGVARTRRTITGIGALFVLFFLASPSILSAASKRICDLPTTSVSSSLYFEVSDCTTSSSINWGDLSAGLAPTTRTVTCTSPLRCDGGATSTLASDFTLSITSSSLFNFATVTTTSGTSPVADSAQDTLALTCSAPFTCTGNSGTDAIALAVNSTSTSQLGAIQLGGVLAGTSSSQTLTSSAAVSLGGLAASGGALQFDYTNTLAGNPALAANQCIFGSTGILCEGSTANLLESLLAFTDPAAADYTATVQGNTGTIPVLNSTSGYDPATDALGIGTAAPAQAIDIDKTSTGQVGLRIQNDSAAVGADARATILNDSANSLFFIMRSSANTGTMAGITVANWAQVSASSGVSGLLFGTAGSSPSVFYTNNTERLRIDGSGLITVPNMHNVTGSTGTAQSIVSGSYTPTITSVTNVAATASPVATFLRVGSVVTVEGSASIDPTTGSTFTRFAISLPIASNLAVVGDLSGSDGYSTGSTVVNGVAYGDATNDRVEVAFVCDAGAAAQVHQFHFSYVVK